MKFDFTGAEQFLSSLSKESSIQQVFEHPAYQIIRQHARKYSHGLEPGDISTALADEPSSFYGLKDLRQNLPQIKKLLAKIRMGATDWLDLTQNSLRRIFPAEDTSEITIYPFIGYDMGIGLNEFLYYMIHEFTHVIYERYHEWLFGM